MKQLDVTELDRWISMSGDHHDHVGELMTLAALTCLVISKWNGSARTTTTFFRTTGGVWRIESNI